MKTLKYTVSLVFFVAHLFGSVYGQSNQVTVKRGPRPKIDLENVPETAYRQGKVLIKLNSMQSLLVDNLMDQNGPESFTYFGLNSLDALNEQSQMISARQFLNHAALGNSFTERHKAWGFHLWFELSFETDADIKSLVQQYRQLEMIERADPSYKFSLIEPVEPENPLTHAPPSQGGGNRDWTPNDTDFAQNQWDLNNTGQYGIGTPGADISMLEAWDIEKGDTGVIVAIIDGGIQLDHPDLADNIWSGIGYNFVDDNATIIPHHHGTHVAGTVAAVSNNSEGIAGIAGGTGAGDGVRLMSCQVFTYEAGDGVHLAPIYAADNGAAISQNSWGYDEPDVYDQIVLDAIDYFNANGGGNAILNGGITIFASGNSFTINEQYYPGAYSEVVCIGATNNSDQISIYTTLGSWLDLSAPGGEQFWPDDVSGIYSTSINSSYAWLQGTSMACPHVSGVAALMVSHAYGLMDPDDVKDVLVNTTDNIDAINPSLVGMFGSGRLNANQALLATNDYISGVTNPDNFTATSAGVDQIYLSWDLNGNGNPVLLAFNQTGNFSEPSGTYQPGDTLDNGAQVLYTGTDVSFLHTGLETAAYHYYKIWSFDNLVYSSGLSSNARTDCDTISEFPWFESFEADSGMRNCWSQIHESGQTDWIYSNGSLEYIGVINSAYEGTQNAMFPIHEGFFGVNITKYVTPVMDISGLPYPELNFRYTQEEYNMIIGDYNTLKIYYRISDQSSWTKIDSIANPANSWTEATYDLPNPSSSYQIAFEGIAPPYGGPNLLDAITVRNKPNNWMGANSNWDDPLNWELGIPGDNDDVIIPSTSADPVISSDVSVKSLQLHNGAILTVEDGHTLTIGGVPQR